MTVIAFCQHRLGRTDGVSLEVDKWRKVMEGMGHTVHYIAGNDDVPGGHFVPELYPFHPVTARIIKNATRELVDYPNERALLDEIARHKGIVKPKVQKILRDLGVELLLPNNLLSVGYNIPGMLALSEILEETGLRAIVHSHDFWWEQSGEVNPTCPGIVDLYRRHAPPALPNVRHVVINRLAQRELKARRGLDARVVPNVFDFDQPAWQRDAYNHDFRQAIGLSETDLLFLQATRVLDRKAIELAIDVVAELNRPENRRRLEDGPLYDGRAFGPRDRIVLVCAGYVEGIGLSASYPENLAAKAHDLGVDVRWVADLVERSRGQKNGKKVYSLWDSYTAADFVTYPSVWEGWGNQLIEALFARLPVVLFEYPVYVTDLKPVGFEVVSLGDRIAGKDARGLVTVERVRLEAAVAGVIRHLKNPAVRHRAVEHNFRVAAEHFSLR
ncbi:MAG: glycosyltransferase family 4 protein, partial [Thermoguttaceae bacterium]